MIKFFTNIEKHQKLAYSYIRIFLGMVLSIRGFVLITNPEYMSEMVTEEKLYIGYAVVAIVHLVGGLLLAVGFLTRFAAFIQIPVMIGAIFFVHNGESLMEAGQSLELAILVLYLLILFALYGSGPLSIDAWQLEKKNRIAEATD